MKNPICKLIKNFKNKKKMKKLLGKKIRLKKTPCGKKSSHNTNIGRCGEFVITNVRDCDNTYDISDNFGMACGWVYDYEFEMISCTLEDLEKEIYSKQAELDIIQNKIDFLKKTKSEEFDEDEFKIYQTLTILESDSGLSIIDKSKLIANLIK